MYVKRKVEARSCNHCCSGKAIHITYSKCVFLALSIQYAKRMRPVVCVLPGCTIFFPRYLINGMIFEKKLLNTKCVFWFSLHLLSETFLILGRIERDIIKKIYIGLYVKYQVFLSDFNKTWILLTYFRKILKYRIWRQSVQWELSCSMRTDTTKLIVAFRNFANAPKSLLHSVSDTTKTVLAVTPLLSIRYWKQPNLSLLCHCSNFNPYTLAYTCARIFPPKAANRACSYGYVCQVAAIAENTLSLWSSVKVPMLRSVVQPLLWPMKRYLLL
jgi:hypothetical protein